MEAEYYESEQDDRALNMEKKKKKKKTKKRKRLDVKMEVISEQPNKIAPLVGYFPSGFDPQKIEEDEEPEVSVFRNKKRPNRLQLVVSPNGSNVNFVGTNYTGEATAAQVCTYALGVLDKETQSLKIVPIASNKIFRLEPKVGGSEICDEEPVEGLKEEIVVSETKADKVKNLTNLYGTKKAKARALKMESLSQKEDLSAQGDMARKIEDIVINKEDLDNSSLYTARNIPPHDSTATIPENAYPLDKIIFKGEWDYLLDILEPLQSGAEIRLNSYPSFVCHRIHRLREIQDETQMKTIACILSYMTHLLKFKDQRSVDHATAAKQHKIPAILRQKFSKMFVDDSFRLTDEKINLIISYVLVLTLFVDNFQTDLSDIAKDLRMTPVSLRQHYEHLGCKLSRVNRVLMVTLPVPLQFPKQRTHRRRK
ncbi:DNA-directed RNA polymerase I subunit RPA49 [Macadamia integrifolia]|uniref:DNA-directed RNA polymerase I subunit RPA49 n=1 Tax=Macadamia integrifolia TaxID=60698 RepID=UPI001C529820|nr:DNA-directed RNA polymerase I subunit RPA49 [Macadamia integrifolia]